MAKKSAPKRAKKAPRKSAKAAAKSAPARPAGVADAIRKLDAGFMKAAHAKSAGPLVKGFYAATAVLMPPNHPAVEGHAAIQAFLQGMIDSGLTSIKLDTASVESAGALAYSRGRYSISLSPPGAAPVQDEGKYVVVYKQQASGAWRAVADIFNSDQKPQ